MLVNPVALMPALLLGGDQSSGTERHEVLGNAGGDEVGELRGQFADGETAVLQEQIEHSAARRIRQRPEGISFVSHAQARCPRGAEAADGDRRHAHTPAGSPSSLTFQCRRSHRG